MWMAHPTSCHQKRSGNFDHSANRAVVEVHSTYHLSPQLDKELFPLERDLHDFGPGMEPPKKDYARNTVSTMLHVTLCHAFQFNQGDKTRHSKRMWWAEGTCILPWESVDTEVVLKDYEAHWRDTQLYLQLTLVLWKSRTKMAWYEVLYIQVCKHQKILYF